MSFIEVRTFSAILDVFIINLKEKLCDNFLTNRVFTPSFDKEKDVIADSMDKAGRK